jgi:hypothetical protein
MRVIILILYLFPTITGVIRLADSVSHKDLVVRYIKTTFLSVFLKTISNVDNTNSIGLKKSISQPRPNVSTKKGNPDVKQDVLANSSFGTFYIIL